MKNFDARMESIRNKHNRLQKARRRKTAIALSCTGVFLAALLLTLFVPYSTALPSVAKYQGSPYYHVIQRLNEFSYQPPQYKNNFAALMAQLSQVKGNHVMNGSVAEQSPVPDEVYGSSGIYEPTGGSDMGAANGSAGGSYVEVTDNQVAGVIEADVFKRSDRYIYHLYGKNLMIYSIAGEDSEKIASYLVSDFMPENAKYIHAPELYLSQDCRILTLVMEISGKTAYNNRVALVNLDISDPKNVKAASQILFSGYDTETRMVNGQLLLTYQYQNVGTADFDAPESFVPTYEWEGETLCIPGEDIVVPESISNKNYTVVCKLDAASLELMDSKALMSYSSDIYVSQGNMYTWYSYWKTLEEDSSSITERQMTDIICVSYADDTLEVGNSFTVEGTVKNQYSLDEYNGMLRVVTSTVADRAERKYDTVQPDIWIEPANKSVNLYCFDLESGEVAGKVESFAPMGEEATSVRFDGAMAYVCTAEIWTLSDPVFFFDLTDPANITWTDTGTIDGYSTSLVDFAEGTLLGIGYDESRYLKVELYRREGEKVVSIADYTLSCHFSEDYKHYYIDRENSYIGLAVYAYEANEWQYLLLYFDGEKLVVEKQLPIQTTNGILGIRADLIGDWLYILAAELTVVKP